MRLVLVLFACSVPLLAACTKRDSGSASDTGAALQTHDSAEADSVDADSMITDANLLYSVDQASATDSIAAELASRKATDGEVRAFAVDQLKDEHRMRAEIEKIAAQIHVVPAAAPGDQSSVIRRQVLEVLDGVSTGASFDKAYIDSEVSFHEDVLGDLRRAEQEVEDEGVRKLLSEISTITQRRLDRARILQARLGR